MADISNEIYDFQAARKGEDVRESLISLAEKVNNESSEASKSSAESALAAQEAVALTSAAATNANSKAQLANEAAKLAETVAKSIQNKLENGEFIGPRGPIGEPFYIAKVYHSISEMNAGYASDGVKNGSYVMLSTGNVEDEDNAKVYIKGSAAYEFIVDLSGAKGSQGDKGDRGEKGDKGDQGEKGDTPSSIPGNAGSATKLQNARKIGGVAFDGGSDIHHYAECATSAGTSSKSVSLNGFNLLKGAGAVVKFINGNTASNPTLNINNTGARSIYYKGQGVPANYITENVFIEMVYDGERYNIVGDLAQAQINTLQTLAGETAGRGVVNAAFNLLNEEIYKKGDCVFVSVKLSNKNALSTGAMNICYTLPAGFRPTKEANIMIGVNVNQCAVGWIRPNGEVVIVTNFAAVVGIEIRIMSHFRMSS
ncbi:collagen-like protein [Lactonifactor longoviformis]|uniref:Collagen triple helix repeat-containing protein n=1 Tax=Lactonifactor longoviformis DSM 17459 TaxID=1122155 RepID=A0A1M4TPZ3_9CLOT|nr:collagen-like protein [Lactonifactor longoviformis]POP32506.1 collagen-like protein [Lactonifactor longoviformis]SHE46570.1 hypothetical protein SAMN02745158_00538 [Lactonifactor longoviformis DSM 17459]